MKKILPNKKFDLSATTIKNLATSALLIAVIQLIRTNKLEIWDRAIYLSVGLLALISLMKMAFGKTNETRSFLYPLSGIVILVVGILGIEKHGTETTRGVDISGLLWLGFGPGVLLALLALIPFIFSLYRWDGLPRWTKYSFSTLAAVVTLSFIPAVWQGGASIIDNDSSEYVINENLAVSAGQLPYVDFIPQYGTLFSWLIAPFKSMLTPDGLVTLSLYLMSIAAIAAVFIGVYLVYKGTNKRSLTLSILLVIPITSIAQFPGRDVFSGTIFSLTGGIPTRIFPGMLIGSVLITAWAYRGKRTRSISIIFYAAIFLSGANVWHSLDFGLALLLSIVLLLLLNTLAMRDMVAPLVIMLLGVISYPVMGTLFGFSVRLDWVGIFVRGFGTGFGSEPIITPGPVLVVLPLIATIAAISTGLLLRERFSSYQIPEQLRRSVLTASFFSLWSAAGFAYYLNRSYASGQMQILFLPLSVALANFIYFVLEMDLEAKWSARSFFKAETWRKPKLRSSLTSLTLAIVMALPLASTVAFPQPNIELKRLTQGVPGHTWPKSNSKSVFEDIAKIKSGSIFPLEDASFFGASGHYVELVTGLTSLNILNSPWDIPITQTTIETGCKPVMNSTSKYLILGTEGPSLFRFENGTLCNVYRMISIPGLSEFRVAERI
jgi:hypothetical protein